MFRAVGIDGRTAMRACKRDVDQAPLPLLKTRCSQLITLNISYSCPNGARSITCGTMRFASRSARASTHDAPNDLSGTSIQCFERRTPEAQRDAVHAPNHLK